MADPIYAVIRGLLLALEQSKDTDRTLYLLSAFVEQLKVLYKAALLEQQKNKAGSLPPG